MLVQNLSSIKKTSNKQGWKLSKTNFGPKTNMANNAYTKPLNLELSWNLVALYYCWRLEKSFELLKISTEKYQ